MNMLNSRTGFLEYLQSFVNEENKDHERHASKRKLMDPVPGGSGYSEENKDQERHASKRKIMDPVPGGSGYNEENKDQERHASKRKVMDPVPGGSGYNEENKDQERHASKGEVMDPVPGGSGYKQKGKRKTAAKNKEGKQEVAKKVKESEDTEENNLLGMNVLVHIENLICPNHERKLRDLDETHLKVLQKEFMHDYKPYKPLLGVTFGDLPTDLTVLANPGIHKVEILGGNHTIAALRELHDTPQTLPVRLYHGLTNNQCLKLAFHHNKTHEFAKKNSWVDNCILARKVLQDITASSTMETSKKETMEWRTQLSYIFSMSKHQLKNSHRVLLHVAAVEEDMWSELTNFFQLWKENKIKKAPKVDLKQHHLSDLTKCKDKQEKISLLRQLNNQEIDFPEFQIRMKKSEQKEDKICNEDDQSDSDEIQCNAEEYERCTDTKQRHQDYLKKNEELKKKIETLMDNLKKEENSRKKVVQENEILRQEIKDLKEQARNFQNAIKVESEKQQKTKKELKEIIDKQKDYEYTIKSLKEKCERKDAQLYLMREVSREKPEMNEKKTKEKRDKQEELTKSIQTKEKRDKQEELTKSIQQTKKTVDTQKKTDKEEQQVSDNKQIECGIVEYTRNTVYLGELNGNHLTFGKKKLDLTAAKNLITTCDINAVTGLLKLYFRELPEPLFTDENYKAFVTTVGLSDTDSKHKVMLQLLHNLPDENYYTIVTMMNHLVKIGRNDSENKMSFSNLSTVFGPTLLHPAIKDSKLTQAEMMQGAQEVFLQSDVVSFFINLVDSGKSIHRSANAAN